MYLKFEDIVSTEFTSSIPIFSQAKKEAILSKAKERLTRYEQWKSTGRKGGRRHMLGFGSRAPREVCLPLDRRSSSQSTLRRSPNSSDYDSYFHRRAVSASSVVRRHCCIDINKLTQGTGMLYTLTSLTNVKVATAGIIRNVQVAIMSHTIDFKMLYIAAKKSRLACNLTLDSTTCPFYLS